MSNRSIAKEMHMSKDTVNKYITEYAEHEAFADNGKTLSLLLADFSFSWACKRFVNKLSGGRAIVFNREEC